MLEISYKTAMCYELTRSGRAQLNKNEKRGHFRKGFFFKKIDQEGIKIGMIV